MKMDSNDIESAKQSELAQKSLVFSKIVLIILQWTSGKSVIIAQITIF